MNLSTTNDPITMKLGLDRVYAVAKRLSLLSPNSLVITVGGTNGKGSTVAGLETIYRQAGYRVGAFTSPLLFTPNEQIRVNGQAVTNQQLTTAHQLIEKARQTIALTPFEFFTLMALWILHQASLDIMILEVGLGGRLDAVNVIDANLSIVTSIGIDHTEWLGSTREAIGFEKAGIYRTHRPAICGDKQPPHSLIQYATDINASLFCQGKEFDYEKTETTWTWSTPSIRKEQLPQPKLYLQNMSTVLMAVTLLQPQLPVKRSEIDQALASVELPGRIQIKSGLITEIYDVSHNPDAIALLAKTIQTLCCHGKKHAVFSMLSDKDIMTSLQMIREYITHWYIAPLNTPRAMPIDQLQAAFNCCAILTVSPFSSIKEAYQAAKKEAVTGDTIIVFGSFHTLSEVLG